LIGLLCVYTMFLIALSNIALAVLLALGPLFVAMLLFDSTRRLFSAWIAQLTNYALVTVLTVMVAALLLQVVKSYAAQTAARGGAILTVDALHMMLIAGLVLLILRQVMPIASSVAGGAALSSFGIVSRTLESGWRRAATSELAKATRAEALDALAIAPAVAARAAIAGARTAQAAYRRASAGIHTLKAAGRRPRP
jgi:type IV secretion system protein VirB6